MGMGMGSKIGTALALVAVFALALVLGRFAGALSGTTGETISSRSTVDHTVANPGLGRSELLYQTHCAKCHGPEGHGDGEAAATMRPAPRDFALRPWRFEPTADSIRTVLEKGIPGTAMPAVGQTLPPADIDLLVQHVLTLSKPAGVASDTGSRGPLEQAGFTRVPLATAPALQLVDADEQAHSLERHRGQVVLLNFWGLGCEHCLARMSKLRELESKFDKAGLRVISICIDADDPQQAQAAADSVAPGHRVYCDATGLAVQRYQVQVLPTVWLVDREGKALGWATGAQEWDRPELAELLEHLLDLR
jgi:mono/diheme cytochrome c family protein/peroxiredoxin